MTTPNTRRILGINRPCPTGTCRLPTTCHYSGRICTNRCGAPVPAATRNQFMCNLPAGHTGAHALIKPPPPAGTSPNADR